MSVCDHIGQLLLCIFVGLTLILNILKFTLMQPLSRHLALSFRLSVAAAFMHTMQNTVNQMIASPIVYDL